MGPFEECDKLEDLGLLLLRRAKAAWQRTRFALGAFRGIVVHADRKGKIPAHPNILIQGMVFTPDDASTVVTRNGVDLIAINQLGQDGPDGPGEHKGKLR